MSSIEVELRYFAWVRERIGIESERVELPPRANTPAALIAWLTERGENYAHAFENPDVVRVAVDKRVAELDDTLAGPREIAFFPPMTGG